MNDIPEVEAPLEARVAALISDTNIAINAGSNKSIEVGMKFSIRANLPIEIIDPDTDEVLDIIDEEIIRVVVTEVKDRYSICKTYRTQEIGNSLGFGLSSELSKALSSYLEVAPRQTIRETITNPFNKIQQRVDASKSVVKVGYRAIEIEE